MDMLTNQVAVVTGASRGIGRAIAIGLAQRGARVVVNYNRGAQQADSVVAAITEAGGDAIAIAADVADEAAVAALAEQTLARWGRIDILVNNAGMTADGPAARMKASQWQQVIDTNLTGVFVCCQAILPHMRAAGYGRIVNIGSLAGLAGNIGQVNYAAAKAGLVGMTRALAREVAREGVTVNVVAPGYIETDMLDGVSTALRTWALGIIAMGRFGTAEEVAHAVGFVASPGASYLTGHVLTLDGGWVMP